MKKNYYQIHEEITDNSFLYMNTMNESFLFIDKYANDIYTKNEDVNSINTNFPQLYEVMRKMDFIVPDDYNEKEIVKQRRRNEQYDESLYHIIVNPTLSCNLSCWYCYEHKNQNSRISLDILEGIKRHIVFHYHHHPYKELKLSFFGGEPFMYFDAIISICNFANSFCKDNGIRLLLDFTTNGTLLTEERLKLLKDFTCTFQITIDGSHDRHNKIKFTKDHLMDTYRTTINNLFLIQHIIPYSFIYVRINFDGNTLKYLDSILDDLELLDRIRTIVILKKIWQVNSFLKNKELVRNAIENIFDRGFMIDYYTQGYLCFGERKNEVVINYDGNIFKCTTINSFDKANSFGVLDTNTGKIIWNETKLETLYSAVTADKCFMCKMYPICYGPCNFHLLSGDSNCYLETLDLSKKEYLMFMYKQRMMNNLIYKTKQKKYSI